MQISQNNNQSFGMNTTRLTGDVSGKVTKKLNNFVKMGVDPQNLKLKSGIKSDAFQRTAKTIHNNGAKSFSERSLDLFQELLKVSKTNETKEKTIEQFSALVENFIKTDLKVSGRDIDNYQLPKHFYKMIKGSADFVAKLCYKFLK